MEDDAARAPRLAALPLLILALVASGHHPHVLAGKHGFTASPVPTATRTAAPTPSPTGTPGHGIALGAFINDGALGGLTPASPSVMDAYATMVGRMPSIVMWYQTWASTGSDGNPFPATDASSAISRGATPEITWMPKSGLNPDPAYKLTAITAGTYDSYIRSWASAAKSWGHPFFLRFAHEMNGDWYPWGTATGNAEGNTPADYVLAWRHVHAIFDSVGVTNALWVWSPNKTGTGFTPYADDYPGDAYVDWVGFDAYNWGTTNGHTWQSLAQTYQGSYNELAALTVKPMMIGETASCEADGSKADWITNGFAALPTLFPRLRAVVWFDTNKECDWRVNSTASSLSAWQQVVASPTYQGRAP